jgi:hypothetical protein
MPRLYCLKNRHFTPNTKNDAVLDLQPRTIYPWICNPELVFSILILSKPSKSCKAFEDLIGFLGSVSDSLKIICKSGEWLRLTRRIDEQWKPRKASLPAKPSFRWRPAPGGDGKILRRRRRLYHSTRCRRRRQEPKILIVFLYPESPIQL